MNNNDFAWISVEDIVPLFALSPNSPQTEIKLHVVKAQVFDLKEIIDINLYNAINEAVKANVQQWKANRTYLAGDKVFYDNAYYTANTTTTEKPPHADYDNYELMNFFYNYVKKWLAGATIVRYSPFLGLHLSQWGLEQYNQEGFGTVSDKRRGEIINSFKSETESYKSLMFQALDEANYTFDGVVYSRKTCGAKSSKLPFTILGAGNKNQYELPNRHTL